jgi:hypothetical protein
MSSRTSPWLIGLIISLAAAVLIGGGSFVLMTIGAHRYLSATAGKSLSSFEQVRILEESQVVPVEVTTTGMLLGAFAALCVPIFLIAVLLQARGRRDEGRGG